MDLERCPDGQAIEVARGLATDYTEEEYLLRGTAASYADELAPYVTRILVRRPEHFSGTVVVEWFNISSFMDAGVEWQYIHGELFRSGTVWVGVSAPGPRAVAAAGDDRSRWDAGALPRRPAVPVLALVTETDVITAGYAGARRLDGPNLRVWELAGASHADTYLNTTGRLDLTQATPTELAAALAPTTRVSGMDLQHLANSGPQHHYVAKAAIRRLDQWVREDVPPPQAPPLASVPGPALERDDHGNALGGVRTPWMEVPTAVLTGVSPDDGVLGRLFGLTVPFSPAILDSLYGDSYLPAFEAATDDAVAKGFLLADSRPRSRPWPPHPWRPGCPESGSAEERAAAQHSASRTAWLGGPFQTSASRAGASTSSIIGAVRSPSCRTSPRRTDEPSPT
ncbi:MULTISPECIES: alpha/beta hydrolase domain-containing protein [unclassified Nonomuraea]|uniref:alpha/beta hydrolase domain-containing protein n=1 Tax=unclassified Nonomuraea TaxID=2593643 RepID=UPI0033D71B6D